MAVAAWTKAIKELQKLFHENNTLEEPPMALFLCLSKLAKLDSPMPRAALKELVQDCQVRSCDCTGH
jgi:hypothetical protein